MVGPQYGDTVIGWAKGLSRELRAPITAYITDTLLAAVARDNASLVLDILKSGVFTDNRSLLNSSCSTS
eukprot:8152607-Ditylum_brightwellii.AAC.1